MADEAVDNGSGNGGDDDFNVPLEDQDTAPESYSGSGSGSGDDAGPETPTPDKDPADGLSQELTDALYRSGLRHVPGESEREAYARLTHHLDRRAAAHYKEAQRVKEDSRRTIEALRNDLTPMLRDYYAQQRRAQIEEQAAQIPPRDSPEYQTWLQEETLRRLDEKEREEADRAERAKRESAERDVAERLARIDEAGYEKVVRGLGLVEGSQPDPEFAVAYDVFSQSGIEAARHMFPDADDTEIQEFIALSQRLDIRRAEMNGMDFRDVMKSRLNGIIDGLVRRGLVTRTAAKAAASAAAESGNGNGKPQQPVKTQTTAQRVTADAQAAARRGPTAVPATTRANVGAGQLPDPGDLDEDDYVEAALAQLLGSEEQRASGHRRSR